VEFADVRSQRTEGGHLWREDVVKHTQVIFEAL